MPSLVLGRHEVIGLKEDFKARAFAKPGGQEFDLVTIKDFFSRDKNCRKVKQCLMAASKQARQQHVKQRKTLVFCPVTGYLCCG